MKNLCFILALLCLALGEAGAQKYNFKEFGIREGLPQSFIYALEQDNLGYLWVGTGEGLARYNGREFRVFTTEDGLAENFISSSLLDSKGRLWFGHYQGGLSRRAPLKFRPVIAGQSYSRVNAMCEAPNGDLLVATLHHGLFRVKEITPDSHLVSQVPSDALDDRRIYAIHPAGENNFLIATNQGLLLTAITEAGLEVKTIPERLAYNHINGLLPMPNGRWLIATRGEGIFEMDLEARNPVVRNYRSERVLLSNQVHFIYRSPNQTYWVGFPTGLMQFQYDDENGLSVMNSFDRQNGLVNTDVRSLLYDREGNYWLGTFGGGLVKFHSDYFNLVDGNNSILSNNINGLLPEGDGRFALATDQGVSFIRIPQFYTGSRGEFRNFEILNIPTSFPIATLCRDHQGRLWVGSSDNGLFIADEENRVLIPTDVGGQVRDRKINHIAVTDTGSIWIATSTGGAYLVDPDGQSAINYSTRNGLLHNLIHNIFVDKFGNTWFVTQGTALAKLWENEFFYYSRKEGLYFNDFNCMYQDRNGDYWIGTNGAGIYKFDGREFSSFTSEDGLRSNYIYSIVEGRDSLLWFVSRNGLTMYNPDNGIFTDYSDFNQNFSLVFNPNAIASDDSGSLYFGTQSGLVSFRPKTGMTTLPIKTGIRNVQVFDDPVSLEKELNLPFDRYRFKFEFEGISLNHPNSVRYQYFLEGYDKDWNNPTAENFAYYTGIEDGTYQFRVRSALPGTEFTERAASFRITIRTPFWKTAWFTILCVIASLIVLWSAIRIRTVQLQNEKRKLEMMVEERTHEIQMQAEELEQYTYAVSHDLKNPVINISGLLGVLKETQPPADEEAKDLYEMLEDTSNHLSNNLQKLMEVIKAKKTVIQEMENVNFEEVFQELKSNIYTMITSSEARIETDFAAPSVRFTRDHVYGILYNLVSNSIKYRSPNREPVIRIQTLRVKDGVEISVADNGLGMDLNRDREKLFGMFKRIHDHTEGSGVGLHLTKAIIEKNGGAIEVESALDVGTTFTIFLPMKYDHSGK